MPISIYTDTTGKYADRIAQYVGVGKSFDLGLAIDRASLRPDTTTFCGSQNNDGRMQLWDFTNEITIGAGKLFDNNASIMFELSYTIFAQLGKKWGSSLVSEYYDYTSETADNSRVFYGLFFRFRLQRTDGRTAGEYSKLGKGMGHLFSPIDFISDFIPVLGILYDLIIVPLLIQLSIKMIPVEVMDDTKKYVETQSTIDKPRNWLIIAIIVAIWIIVLYFFTN